MKTTTKTKPEANPQHEKILALYRKAVAEGKTERATGIEIAVKILAPDLKLSGKLDKAGKSEPKASVKKRDAKANGKTPKAGMQTADTDATYEAYLDNLGQAESPKRSVFDLSEPERRVVLSDQEAYEQFEAELDGTASRRRAVANVEAYAQEREQWWLQEAKTNGGPLPRDMEHLRPQLRGYGY